MKRIFFGLLLLFLIAVVFQGCSRRTATGTATGSSQSIQIKGSDTMVNLGGAWAEAFNAKNPGANVTVTGGGSGTGIAALINGTTDIAEASRAMKPEEIDAAKKNGYDPKEFTVARDGVAVIVNPANNIDKLTISQLADIYTGKITNWKELGGKDRQIVVLSRDKSSGTHVFFLEHVLRKGNSKGKEQYGSGVLMQVSSQAIADEVAGNPDAIGYVGMGYVDPAKHKEVAIASDSGSPYVKPTPANVVNNSYPIARPLYFYTPKEPTGEVKKFIDFVLSNEGQAIVEKEEFVPVKPLTK